MMRLRERRLIAILLSAALVFGTNTAVTAGETKVEDAPDTPGTVYDGNYDLADPAGDMESDAAIEINEEYSAEYDAEISVIDQDYKKIVEDKTEDILAYGRNYGGYWILYKNGLLTLSTNSVQSEVEKVLKTDMKAIFHKDKGQYPWYKYRKKITKVYFSDGIRNVIKDAFKDCEAIREVRLSADTKSIRKNAFKNCFSLESIELPAVLTSIGDRAFYGCRSLQSIRWKKETSSKETTSTKYLSYGYNIFKGCTNLESAEISKPFKYSRKGMIFRGCRNLKYVYLPAKIGVLPFDDTNTSLARLYYGGKEGDSVLKQTIKVDKNTTSDNKGKKKILEGVDIVCEIEGMPWCIVTYDTGGEGEVSPFYTAEGGTIKKMPQPEPYSVSNGKPYYVSKWLRDKNDGNSAFKFREDQITDRITTLYAKWEEAKPVSVNYYSAANELFKEETVYQGRKIIEPDEIPERDGYEFTYWFDTEDTYEKGQLYYKPDEKYRFDFNDEYVMSTEPVSLYAHWAEKGLRGFWSDERDGITVSFNYTDSVEYDGRSHVYMDGKSDTTSKVHDIRVGNMVVTRGQKEISDVKIKKVAAKNNRNIQNTWLLSEAFDKDVYGMWLNLKVDTGDKTAKKILNKMLTSKVTTEKDDDGSYKTFRENDWPIVVDITPVYVTSANKIYTESEVKADPSLAEKDGIFIYSGKTSVKWGKGQYNTIDDQLVTDTLSIKTEIKGLAYQKVYDLGGVKKVKRLNLKPGGWKIHQEREKFEDDDDVSLDYEEEFASKKCDYYMDFDYVEPGDKEVTVELDGDYSGDLTVNRSADDYGKDPAKTTNS